MPVYEGLAWTFDTVASDYETFRPGYGEALYRALFAYAPVDAHSDVVEIGSGTGQATAPVLATGCRLTAVECGARFSQLLQEKFGENRRFALITDKFEDTLFPPDTFDLVFSATAFHWVPEKLGYEKVYAMLKRGGAFARFANHPYPAKDNPALEQALDALYDRYYNRYYGLEKGEKRAYTRQQAAELAELAGKYGFTDLRYALFERERVFTAEEYVALLGTYSDHIAIEERVRTAFFAEIAEAIRRHGGSISVWDTMDLQLARKPCM